MDGLAVKTTLVPSQMVVLDGFLETKTDGVALVVTDMVILLLITVVGLGQVDELVM